MIREILEHKNLSPLHFLLKWPIVTELGQIEFFFFFPPKKRAVKIHKLMYHSKNLGEKLFVSKMLCNKSYIMTLFGCYILQKEKKSIKMA